MTRVEWWLNRRRWCDMRRGESETGRRWWNWQREA